MCFKSTGTLIFAFAVTGTCALATAFFITTLVASFKLQTVRQHELSSSTKIYRTQQDWIEKGSFQATGECYLDNMIKRFKYDRVNQWCNWFDYGNGD